MLYVRGSPHDYDKWANDGAEGWAWKDVFPYFLKSEDNLDQDIADNGIAHRPPRAGMNSTKMTRLPLQATMQREDT